MNVQTTTGHWLTSTGWRAFECVHGSHINEMRAIPEVGAAPQFIPAPVDLHVHGGGGADVMQGERALKTVLRTHACNGTAALLATSVTSPTEHIDKFLRCVKNVMSDAPQDGAELLGAHLEGPFINPDKRGAQPDFATPVKRETLERWFATEVVKVITYAPEMDQDDVVLKLCDQYGVKAQLGHTLCRWQQAAEAIRAGAGVTHLYNAMSGVAHRDGGAASAALAYTDFAEIITDGIHVDQAAFDLAYRSIPHLYSVTDATSATAMPDGQYRLGTLTVHKQGDRVLLPDGTLAGSCLTQLRSLQVLRQWGLSWPAISRCVSEYPARWIGAGQYGRIGIGTVASWLEIRAEVPVALWIRGRRKAFNTPDE